MRRKLASDTSRLLLFLEIELNKNLKDFTTEELIDRATGAFGEQDPSKHAKSEDERNALYAVLNFKCSEQQSKLNEKIKSLTQQLTYLTWALVVLTVVMTVKMFIR